jgi:beta-N-acetylhexosaminidase
MEMGGILTQASMEEAAVKAVLAGTDVIEICKDAALVLRAYEALLTEAERSAAFRRRVEAAAQRVIEHKDRHLDAAMPRTASAAQIEKLRTSVKKFAEDVAA